MNADQIRILVVDDDADIAHGTARLLEKAGYVIAMAADGVEALAMLATFQPQLVLSDRDMPAMDGVELCRRIKSDPARADVFVVLISGMYTQSDEQAEGLDAGADGYIPRPIANRELLARVEAFVRIIGLNHRLQTSEQKFSMLVESVPQMVWMTRPDGWNIYFNQQWVDYTGLTLEESYGHGWNAPFHPDDRQRASDAWQEATQKDAPYALECRLRRADGVYRWWLIRGTPHRNAKGEIIKWFGTCTDIDEIKMAEAALVETKTLLQTAMDQSSAGIAIAEAPGGQLRYVNRAGLLIRGASEAEALTGVDAEHYVASWTLLHLDGTPMETDEVPLARAVRFGETCSKEFIIRRTANEDRIVQANAAPILDDAGRVTAGIVVFHDITEAKQAERELRDNENLLTQAQIVAGLGVYSLDLTTGFWTSSAVMDRLFGIEESYERSVEGWLNLIHPDDRAMMVDYLENDVLGLRKSFDKEYRIIRPDDQAVRWMHGMGMLEHDDSNRLIKMIGAIKDITERKRMEAEMLKQAALVSESEARYAQLAEQSLTIAWEVDVQGLYTYVSKVSEAVWGYRPDELMGRQHFYDLHPESGREAFKESAFTVFAQKQPFVNLVNAIQTKDGQQLWLSTNGSPILDAEGNLCGYRGSDTDITERRETAAKMLVVLDRAEAANRAKSEFLGVMSHELRTPLNGVLGFAQLLAYTPLNSEQKDYVETISNSGEHLLAIISDILDFTSIDAGTLAVHVAPLAVADLVKTAEDPVRKTAADKGLELRCELAIGVPHQIPGDERRIRQILINLLGNAVKFTDRGSVVLRVATASDGGRRFLDFCVEDTGLGIPSETLGCLFMPFTQADTTTTRKFGGTGLGLAISKRIAEAMGGAITVTSTPGKGSTFTFRLPLESAPSPAGGISPVPSNIAMREQPNSAPTELRPPVQTAKSPTPSGGGLVLVVDDDQTSRMVAGKMLEKLGYQVASAASGGEALKAFAPGKFFAILMDMTMPEMDGLETTRKIREIEAAATGRVPIIALTGNVFSSDRERCLKAGMDDVLYKPLKKEELAEKLATIAQR